MPTKKKESHTGFRNNNLFCFNCGASFDMQLPQSVTFAAAVMKEFDKAHTHCEKTWTVPQPDMSQTLAQRIMWWYKGNGERGTSSETIFSALSGNRITKTYCHPSDPDDFRRCYLLLKCMPEWNDRLSELCPLSQVWEKLVYCWPMLTELMEKYLAGETDAWAQINKLMKTCGC